MISAARTGRLAAYTLSACLVASAVALTGCGQKADATSTTEATDAGTAATSDTTSLATPAAPVRTGPIRVLIDAEDDAEITGAFQVVDFEGASGGKCVFIPLGDGGTPETAGKMTFTVDVPTAKTVQFWVRAYWTGTCANSITLDVPGYPSHIIGEDGTYNDWHWLKGPALPLDAGTHTITLVQREDDIRIDQIIATSNTRVKPMGIEE